MAKYDYIVKYWIDAECISPLRTSGVENNTEEVLMDSTGVPMIQGSSIAGVFKNWLEKKYDKTSSNFTLELFGGNELEGKLVFSDGLFDEKTEQTLRPRVHINGKTGAAENNHKFDVLLNVTGSKVQFTITWLGNKNQLEQVEVIEKMLSAMNQGEIRLGAFKSSGLGLVRLKVQKQEYNMRDPEQRMKWIMNTKDASQIKLPTIEKQARIEFIVQGFTTNFLIKSNTTERNGEKGSVIVNIKENETFILPGSSLKGAIRSRVEAIAEFLQYDHAIIDDMFGRGAKINNNNDNKTMDQSSNNNINNNANIDQSSNENIHNNRNSNQINVKHIYENTHKENTSNENDNLDVNMNTDMNLNRNYNKNANITANINESDNGVAGSVIFEDVKLIHAESRKITRIRINKFTGGAMDQGMMHEEPIKSEVEFHIQMKNEPKQCILMLFALRDLGLGIYNLGSGYNIGRGYIKVNDICVKNEKSEEMHMRFLEDDRYVMDDQYGILRRWKEQEEVK